MGYEKSPRIRDIAEQLINDHHPHLKDAKELVEYYTRDDGGWIGPVNVKSAQALSDF
ncbi:hypothetical protein [Desulfosporosinus sp. SB140]|uniref:hypothetical protein n=1 Tax=Desulfosporosinus paludis TaxID=3115649 RepID=UPI00388D588E